MPDTESKWSPWVVALVAVLPPLVFLPLVGWRTPESLGSWGAIIHLAGLGVVAFGLIETRNQLRGRSTWSVVRAWARRMYGRLFRRRRPSVETVRGSGKGLLPSLNASLEVEVQDPPEDRIARLEARVERLVARMDRVDRARRAGDEKVEAKVREEKAAREAAVEEVQGQLRSLTLGGLRIEAVGLTWLASGFVVATWPECFLQIGPCLASLPEHLDAILRGSGGP